MSSVYTQTLPDGSRMNTSFGFLPDATVYQDQTLGAIGYDTPLLVPDWAKQLFPKLRSWSDSNFPSIVEQASRDGLKRRIQFGRGGQLCSTASNVLSLVVKVDPDGDKGVHRVLQ